MKGLCLLLLTALFFLFSPSARGETRVMVVSDLHYMAPALCADGALFERVLRNGDGKISQHSEELMDALLQTVRQEKPDALLVTGDLTFNGEKESHRALAAWFRRIEEAGTPVWVLPGNHDINTASPVGFTSTGYYRTENVSPQEFSEIYADFLLPGEANLSYLAPLSVELYAAMTDVAFYQGQAQTFGLFTAAHGAWLRQAIAQARSEGAGVIAATHHSLLPHTDFARDSFLMFGNEGMAGALREAGVSLNLSGHLHIQHIARQDGLTDAALGAFCVWPHRYALVDWNGGQWRYEARSLEEGALPEGFLAQSEAWFAGITREKTLASLAEASPEDASAMADYAARFNLAYFSGAYRPEDPSWRQDPAYALWERQESSGFWQYMRMVMEEAQGNNLQAQKENQE